MNPVSDIFLGATGWALPLLFAEVRPFVQAARQDAARAALGHGRPIAAAPWSADGASGPGTQRSEVQGRMQGRLLLLTFLERKVRRRKGAKGPAGRK